MKSIIMPGAALAALLCVGAVQAATPNPANVSRYYTDTVAPAQMQAYETGVKSYNQCLSQHGFKYAEMALEHHTGNTYMVSSQIGPVTWADFDTIHATGQVCDSVWSSDVNPYLQSETSAFAVLTPGFSRLPKDMSMSAYPLVDVIHFWLKPGMAAHDAFTNGVKEIYVAEVKSNWPVYSATFELVAAGPGAPDYELDVFNKNWADFGAPNNPPLWKMLANAYGKKKADEIRTSLDNAIAKSEEHVDRFAPDLSYTPSSH